MSGVGGRGSEFAPSLLRLPTPGSRPPTITSARVALFFFRNPFSACVGLPSASYAAFTGGPFTSSSRSLSRSGMCDRKKMMRRGVLLTTTGLRSSGGSPRSSVSFVSCCSSVACAASCIHAGISSVNSSKKYSAIGRLQQRKSERFAGGEELMRASDGLLAHRDVAESGAPFDVVDRRLPRQKHRQALDAVGDLRGDRREVDAAGLLKIRELRDLHAVEQDLPADAPRAEGGRLPVVLFEADVVAGQVESERAQGVEIHLLHVERRRLQDHLKLVVLAEAEGVVAVASVG